ncbi:MAG: uncharacterized protein QOJ57_2332 [Thermoleophilaceae bacterium]|jgi:uncharacterized protein YqjF (DUF2071 family)|nr:uncharacterized protein [Thermoleophilaceae bacterium]
MTASYAHDVEAAARQKEALAEHGHRPWPLPDAPWIMGQTWERLAFLHWRVPEEALRRVVHPAIPLDTFDGSAWLGVTPFTVTGLHLRHTPPPPLVSSFHEINVRTYATVDGKPGIYFLSLDAASKVAVHAARAAYRVPYFHAEIEVERESDRIHYRHERTQPDGPPAAFEAEYGPTGTTYNAAPGSLDYFLAERYCLYTLDEDQRVHRGEIHHPPWPLQPATAAIARNTMAAPYGIELEGDPIAHYAHRQDVVFWPLQPL